MEHYDSQKARQVWQRVWGEQQEVARPLQQLLLAEMQTASDFGRLQRRFPEMKPLLAQSRKSIDCLRGILLLTAGTRPAPSALKAKEEPVDILLRRCIGQCLKAAADYAAHANDPEYGCIFAQLAEQKRQHCRRLLELIGAT